MDSGRDIEGSEQLVQLNECAGEAANTFFCTDDNSFAHCVGGGSGFPKDCAPGVFCIQQDNPVFNPCVGFAPAGNNGNAAQDNDDDVVVDNDDDVVVDNDDDVVVEDDNDDDVVVDNGGNNGGAVDNPGAQGPFSFDQGTLPPRDGSVNLRDAFSNKIDPKLDGEKNVGKGTGEQFITGQCFSNADCRVDACCARLVLRDANGTPTGAFDGRCSGIQVQDVGDKDFCGFDVRRGF